MVIYLLIAISKKPETNFKKYFDKLSKDLKRGKGEQTFFCQNHLETPATTVCRICEKVFCEACTKEHNNMLFCIDHFNLFIKNEWEEVDSVVTSPHDSTHTMYLYNFKNQLWEEEKIPSYIQTHYKINVDNDQIESHIKLYAQKKISTLLKTKINFFKEKHNDS